MHLFFKLLLNTLAVALAAYLLPGVGLADAWTALVVAVLLGISNTVVKPILVVLTFPITMVTFGLFLFVLNAALILVIDRVVPGFSVDGFWWALLFSIVVSIIGWFLGAGRNGEHLGHVGR